MYSRKESSAGAYYPTFLCMDLDVADSLDYLLHYPMDPHIEALFLHEYIHYLQDLTTVSGYARICVVADTMKWAANNCKKRNIRVPLQPKDVSSFNLDINDQHLRTSEGNGRILHDPKINAVVGFELTEKEMMAPNKKKITVPVDAVFTFRDTVGQEYNYHVGEYAISECQAYMIEQHIYPNTIDPYSPAPDCPYRVVQKIFETCCPRYYDLWSMLAACEACLMHVIPGMALKNLIDELNQTPNRITPEQVFFLGISTNLLAKSGQRVSYMEGINSYNNQVVKQLSGYFKASYFTDCREFIEKIFPVALEYRKWHPFAILEIARGGWVFQNKTLKFAASILGCSSIMTKDGGITQLCPICHMGELGPGVFASFKFLHDLLFTDTLPNNHMINACPLKKWCTSSFAKQNLEDITQRQDAYCDHMPWLNANNITLLRQCVFGRVAASFGLQGKNLR